MRDILGPWISGGIPLSESLGGCCPDKAGAYDIPIPTVCRHRQHSDQQSDAAASDQAGAACGGPDAGLSDLLLQFLVWDHPPGMAGDTGLGSLEVWEEGHGGQKAPAGEQCAGDGGGALSQPGATPLPGLLPPHCRLLPYQEPPAPGLLPCPHGPLHLSGIPAG